MANLELKFNTKKHNEILEALRNRLHSAAHAVAKKASEYAENEDEFMAYMKTSDADALRESKKDEGKPEYVSLQIPYSYAVLMSWHTYVSSVFLSRSPVLQFQGRHGESEHQTQAVEAIMDYQTQVGGHLVPYYIWLLDAGKYGVGIMGNYWDEEFTQVSEIVEEPVTYLGITIAGKTQKKKRTRRVRKYQGNRLFNIRPQDFVFDSRVSLANFQKGEFCGRYTDIGWNDVAKSQEYGQYYNVAEVRRMMNNKHNATSQGERDTGSTNLELPDAVTKDNSTLQDELKSPDFVNIVEMHVELIPKDWGLGKSTYPEKWVFTIANDKVIIESQPYDALHGDFPYNVLEYEMEGYGLYKRGMLEMLAPLEDTMTWLMNTHFYNVRAVLNGQFIADPSRITLSDFKSEGGGRIVRTKPTAYGQDIRTMFHQISTTDVTQNHLRDASIITDLIQRVSGVTDNIMGMVNSGGRKSATEIRSSNAFGGNRLKTQSEYFSAMGFAPQSQQLLQNTQQKYDGEQKFKLAGDLIDQNNAEAFMNINPESVAGFFDFVPVDGTMPVDRFAQVTMWTQMFGQLRQMPEVMAGYDMASIFAWVAQLGGLKNIKRFKINVLPPGGAQTGAANGSLVPLGGANGAGTGSGAGGGSPQNAAGVQGASQQPGVGTAG